MARKKLGRPSNRFKILNTELSKSMSKSQLQNYIKMATREINKDLKFIESDDVLSSSLRNLQRASGVNMVKGKLGMGLNKKKDELLFQAGMLQGHFNLDVYTEGAREYMSEKTLKAYETFKTRTGMKDLSESDYIKLVEIMGAMGSSVLEQLSSKQIRTYFMRVKKKAGTTPSSKTFTSALVDAYNDLKSKTNPKTGTKYTKAELRKAVGKELLNRLAK